MIHETRNGFRHDESDAKACDISQVSRFKFMYASGSFPRFKEYGKDRRDRTEFKVRKEALFQLTVETGLARVEVSRKTVEFLPR